MIPLIFVGIVALVAAVGIGGAWWYEKKRTEALKAVARSMGLEFEDMLAQSTGAFYLFNIGRSRESKNVLTGNVDGVGVTIFDYKYTTGSGRSSRTLRHSVMLMRSGRLRTADFMLRPESLGDKIVAVFGQQDIDFDTHPSFSRRYLLRGSDEASVRSVFGDQLLTFFEEHSGLSVESNGSAVLFYRNSKRVAPDQIAEFMREGLALAKLLA